MDMIILEDNNRAATNEFVRQRELDNLKLNFYVVIIVFSGALFILFVCVIVLFAWIQKLSMAQKKKNKIISGSMGRTINPGEELAKRYTVAAEDHNNLYEAIVSKNVNTRSNESNKFDNSMTQSINSTGLKRHVDRLTEPQENINNRQTNNIRQDALYY